MANPRNKELESKLLRLFQEKKLKSKDDLLVLFCKDLGFEHSETKLPSRSSEYWGDGQVAELVSKESFEILAQQGDPRVGGFAVVYGTLHDFNLSSQRTIILQLRKTFPDALYIFVKPQTFDREQGAQIDMAHARLRAAAQDDGAAGSRLLIRRFRFGPGERYRTAAERLAKLDLSTLKSRTAIAITALCNEAFDKEALTNEFFKKLDQHIKAIESDLREHQRMSGPEAFEQAQLLIERLIFLYFAQNRGWLDQKPDYLVANFKPHQNKPNDFSFYSDFLLGLFRKLSDQSFGDQRYLGIPFLNGGLFDDDEFRLPSAALHIRNETFTNLFDDLLEAYNFTVREDTPLSQEVAVDPEMLGKIFESIVLHAEAAGEEYQAPDKRKATGSYYTPRIVVHFICRESLRLYFAQRSQSLSDPACRGTWSDRISRLFKEIDPTNGFSEEELKTLKSLLSPLEAACCLDVLCGPKDSKGERIGGIRTLDPAVGSGAFPVGLLHELISLRRIFETAENGYVDPVKTRGTRWIQKTKELFIQSALFGVDIQQQAIEICRLRLWLTLLVDYELGVNPFEAERSEFIKAINKISQLPNLEMNFKRGDSLHDYICGRPVRIEPQNPSQYATDLEQIEKLGTKLHKAKRSETKKKYRLEILDKRIALAQRIITDEIAALKKGLIVTNWFGESLSEREERERTETEIERLNTALKQLACDEKNLHMLKQLKFDKDFYSKLRELEGSEMDGPLNFAWRIDFPHVLSGGPTATLGGEFALINQAQRQQELTTGNREKLAGGFDLVVGNPPFVNVRSKSKLELYRERWPSVCVGDYQMLCPFFALGFSLLRPCGQLGFIASNGFLKREFGKPLIEDCFEAVDIQKIVDCSGLMFPGHGTPTCIVYGRQIVGGNDADWKSFPVRIVTILPGGGDLRTPPEESPLWHTIELQQDPVPLRLLENSERAVGFRSLFEDSRIAVGDCDRKRILRHPTLLSFPDWPTLDFLNRAGSDMLREILTDDVGFMFILGRNDIFMSGGDHLRREKIPPANLKPLYVGDEIRDWQLCGDAFLIFPYDQSSIRLLDLSKTSPMGKYFELFTEELSNRPTFKGSFKEAGRKPYQFHQMPIARAKNPRSIAFSQIATHGHFVVDFNGCAFNEKAPLIKLPTSAEDNDHHVLSSALNSSTALFWLKHECFSKRESEEGATDTYFEFAGKKVQRLPLPTLITETFRGKPNPNARPAKLARECWERGRELPSLALRKLFEKPDEAYHAWNASLPGYVKPHKELGGPFSSTAELKARFDRAQEIREELRCKMIAQQEELDWLVYAAYGLIAETHPAAACLTDETALTLDREERPFSLSADAGSDFDKAVVLIPAGWPDAKKNLWRARLEAIRDNEHIRRIEQPVYKRRWDEQWKVSNRWESGPVAYVQELIDAFAWWLSEKAEWHLEHKARGPIALSDWSAALFKDTRVAAAWPVVADAIYQVEKYKFDALDEEKKENRRKPKADDSYTAFERFFRETVLDQSVAHGIPAAIPWNELAAKKKWTPTQLKKAQAVRGKLNVPRERFRTGAGGEFFWAGK
jgi:type I restriction-modification system DNA methylase subunit